MSKTDKTKPLWVKIMHGDLDWAEVHDHRDGICDMPPMGDIEGWQKWRGCHRHFTFTGTRVCCCSWCHRNVYWPAQRHRREKKLALRNWQREYDGRF